MTEETTTLKIESNSGNFAWSAQAEVSDEMLLALAHAGLLQICQRTPVSAWEKACAYPGEKAKRPAGFKREDIAWGEVHAAKLRDCLSAAKLTVGETDIPLGVTATVGEHIPGGTAETKFAAESKIYLGKAGDAARLVKLAEGVGYAGEIGDGKTAPTEFLSAIRRYLRGLAEAL